MTTKVYFPGLLLIILALVMKAALVLGGFTKTLTTCGGLQYVYDYAPAREAKPTFLLLHGYPSSRGDWRHQFADLSAAGFGAIAPDCLGYGESDKPTRIETYNLKNIRALGRYSGSGGPEDCHRCRT